LTVVVSVEAGVGLWLAVVAGAGVAGVSAGAGAGAGGADAIVAVVLASVLGVDGVDGATADAVSVLARGVLFVLTGAGDSTFASTRALAGAERDAVVRSARLELLLVAALDEVFSAVDFFVGAGVSTLALRAGAAGGAAVVSASVGVVAVGAGAALDALLPASATTAGRFAAGGGDLSESLRL
jgi:hypothetical protein